MHRYKRPAVSYARVLKLPHKYCMRFYEFKTVKPLTPDQQRVRALQRQIEATRRALAAERERQRRTREQQRSTRVAQQLGSGVSANKS
jgi:hypothetical protein